MAIIIDVLEDIIVPPNPVVGTPGSRSIEYTARENGGTMYYFTSNESASGVPLTSEDELYPPSTAIAQFLYDVAEASGTAIPDIVTWTYIEKRRVPVYRSGWSVVRNQVGDTGITNVSPTWNYQFNILVQLATDSALAANFQANAWRLGLIANKDVQITRAIIDGLTPGQRVTLYLLSLSFMGLGHGIGLDGNTILEDYLE